MNARFSKPVLRPMLGMLLISVAGCTEHGDPVRAETRDQIVCPDELDQAGEVRIVLAPSSDDEASSRIEVVGLSPDVLTTLEQSDPGAESWSRLLTVRVADAGEADADVPAMLGEYAIENGRLVFEPAFPLQSGLKYRATFDPAALPDANGEAAVTQVVSLPERPVAPPTVVEAVYPSQQALPENLLRFYLHFSAPMSRGEAYRRVRLFEESGREVVDPWLELGEELWDGDATRFTLFFDPGRIKRGVLPREEIGPALEEGKTYTLEIDADWTDAAGNPLHSAFRRTFTVTAPDDVPPDPARWTLTRPGGPTDPLQVVFDEPLDHAMLHRVLTVADADGHHLDGEVEIDRHETRWRFRPARNWQPGRYALVVETILEDRAGNRIGRPFEVDINHPVERSVPHETVTLPFEVFVHLKSR